jgi:hypothetical protein
VLLGLQVVGITVIVLLLISRVCRPLCATFPVAVIIRVAGTAQVLLTVIHHRTPAAAQLLQQQPPKKRDMAPVQQGTAGMTLGLHYAKQHCVEQHVMADAEQC